MAIMHRVQGRTWTRVEGRPEVTFSKRLQEILDEKMVQLAAESAAIMRQKVPKEEGDLKDSIRVEGNTISANAGHSLVTQFGSKTRKPDPTKPKRKPRKPKRKKLERAAQPYFFESVEEAAKRTKRGI
jgi:hypothetical protein